MLLTVNASCSDRRSFNTDTQSIVSQRFLKYGKIPAKTQARISFDNCSVNSVSSEQKVLPQ